MPDASIKVYNDDFPPSAVIDQMKVGDRFIWVPSPYWRRVYSVGPVLYIIDDRGRLTSNSAAGNLALFSPRG